MSPLTSTPRGTIGTTFRGSNHGSGVSVKGPYNSTHTTTGLVSNETLFVPSEESQDEKQHSQTP